MKVDLSVHDLALCVAALEAAANDLRKGILASERLGLVRQDFIEDIASDMDALRTRLRAERETLRKE